MKILAIEREQSAATPEQFQPHLRPEAARVWELYQADVIREMCFDRDHHTAVLILECSSVEQVREILGMLPLVKEELIAFDLIPLVPYSGFSRLLGNVSPRRCSFAVGLLLHSGEALTTHARCLIMCHGPN